MSLPEVVSREQWLEARQRLLAEEKAMTRRLTELSAERRRLPMVRVAKEYVFEGPKGPASLADLFGDSRQLIVQHVMFGPDWDTVCPGCTASINELSDGLMRHMRSRETEFVLVSRAPLDKIQACAADRGWTTPWYSSYGSDFNYDYQVTLDREAGLLTYNFREEPELVADRASMEMPGYSCFLRDGDAIYHTNSVYGRGAEGTIGAYAFLDLTAFGRSEDWEEPKGRAPRLHGADPTFTD